jgi:membrane protein DedA with SNARE-associated domain
MISSLTVVPVVIAALAAVSFSDWANLDFIENLSDSFWTYALLGATAIVIEELSPIFGGIAANEGDLKVVSVITGVTIGGWVCTTALYIAGRLKWDWIRRRLPRLRAAGTVALRVVGRNPLTASFLVRFLFGLRVVLPLACGAARVPAPTFLIASLAGSLVWSTLFTVIGYAAGEAAVQVVGKLGRVGEIIGAVIVTAAVFVFIRWNNQRRAKKDARKRRNAAAG